mmetsp:Transcript_33323/g.38609  ORF Transcript_33323/g.38609 Transcript_33323/m.38609 type:complete len:345 (-) Transcript_33323:197-1231(-)|eukprot:CAMPEP_0194356098 /NCGR_PEP_ID=MMETSP0174-20130528/3875_1 /TAXON_ID=216777 /ORGANISM="Proboscia alata, Strain PI-D3" /LENGTH=344 /DNA_ID=CAMNT_0039125607 /DNA_START=84 /DNA_END=1118 /DNA_ORIENTATION=+
MAEKSAQVGNAKLLSAEESAKAKAELGVDDFQDAVEDVGDGVNTFDVSVEEMSIIRAELACEFPDDYKYLSDAYIESVASKPYSKDMSIRRPLEYSIEKLSDVMKWRDENGTPTLKDMVKIANGPSNAPEATENYQHYERCKAVTTALNNGSLYWHGLTKEGHPILWIRCNRKPWYPDVDADIKALIILADIGISCMPKNITDFVVVSDSTSPPPPIPTFMIELLKVLVKGYPDRLHLLASAPVSSIIQFVMKLLLPLMPGRLSTKIHLSDVEGIREKLEKILPNGKDDIPTFFNGPVNHDEFYPDESYCSKKGPGVLKFDFYGMIERLEKARDDFEAKSASSN